MGLLNCSKDLLWNLIFQVMLDTVGPELQVVNKTDHPISLKADTSVVLTPNQEKEATPNLLPINFSGLSQVRNAKINICLGFASCF